MKAMLKTIGMTVALALVLAVVAGRTWAEDAKIAPSPEVLLKALSEAGKPGPEHEKLQPFVGDWTLTMKMWTDPSQSPAEFKGIVERKWIMGGRFVQENVRCECSKTGKTFEGLGLLGYHAGEKKFTTVHACGVSGTISNSLSTFDASGTKLTCATEECCPLTGQKVKGRDEVIIESNDRIVTNVFKTVDGREVKIMEIVNVRKQ